MSTGNTLMVKDMLGRAYMADNGGFEPKPWWLIVFIVGFIVFEIIKCSFLDKHYAKVKRI